MKKFICAGLLLAARQTWARSTRELLEGDDDEREVEVESGEGSDDSESTSTTNFRATGGSGTGCTPSDIKGYNCMSETGISGVTVHYRAVTAQDTTADMAIRLNSETGWVGIGFPSSPGQMVGATSVIATSDAPNGVGIYDLTSTALSGVTLASSSSGGSGRRLANAATEQPAQLSNLAVSRSNGQTVASYTMALPPGAATASRNYIVAMAPSDALEQHSEKGNFNLALTGQGNANTSGATSSQDRTRWAHGWLGALAWGLLVPLAVMFANTCKPYGTAWFHLHRILNVLGVLCAFTTAIIAFAALDNLDAAGATGSAHKALGVISFIGAIILPIAGFIRPKKPALGEKKTTLRLLWEWTHKLGGWITLLVGIATIFTGLYALRKLGSISSTWWRNAQIIVLGVIGIVWLLLLMARCMKERSNKKNGKAAQPASSHTSSNSSARANKAHVMSSGRTPSYDHQAYPIGNSNGNGAAPAGYNVHNGTSAGNGARNGANGSASFVTGGHRGTGDHYGAPAQV